MEKYVGQVLELKIIELDRSKNNVVFSHKEVLEDKFQRAKEEAFNNLREGSIVNGVVRRLTDFGAFVDIGSGVEGLLHVSEMAYSRVNHPSDVLSEGDEIKVMVLGVDKENERISLGLKQTLPDPWIPLLRSTQWRRGNWYRNCAGLGDRELEDGGGPAHISQLARHVARAEELFTPVMRCR